MRKLHNAPAAINTMLLSAPFPAGVRQCITEYYMYLRIPLFLFFMQSGVGCCRYLVLCVDSKAACDSLIGRQHNVRRLGNRNNLRA
jgi:hypothetical protein